MGSTEQQVELKGLLACNAKLAAAYQVKEEPRGVLGAPEEMTMAKGARTLRRTERKANVPDAQAQRVAPRPLAGDPRPDKYRPPVERIEAPQQQLGNARAHGPWIPGL